MGSLDKLPKTWIPYVNNKNCSQGFCSIYCPQWCYMAFPPPPPFNQFPNNNNSITSFSPLVIAIIGILASAFLLVSYYTIISKFCATSHRETNSHDHQQNEVQLIEDNHNPSMYEPWQATTTGLDESIIKAITVCQYKKGDGLIEGSDCSVCLSEFQENESLRLLPKCSHAFHVPCIDTWLKSHSSCPLCRANIVFVIPSQPQLPSPLTESSLGPPEAAIASQLGAQDHQNHEPNRENIERVIREDQEVPVNYNQGNPKSPLRVFSDLGDMELARDLHTIIEIGEIDQGTSNCGQLQMIRRSVSMDHSCQISCHQIHSMNQDHEFVVPSGHREGSLTAEAIVGPSKNVAAGGSKCSSSSTTTSQRLISVLSPVSMKRSFSSGRLVLLRHAIRGRGNTMNPILRK